MKNVYRCTEFVHIKRLLRAYFGAPSTHVKTGCSVHTSLHRARMSKPGALCILRSIEHAYQKRLLRAYFAAPSMHIKRLLRAYFDEMSMHALCILRSTEHGISKTAAPCILRCAEHACQNRLLCAYFTAPSTNVKTGCSVHTSLHRACISKTVAPCILRCTEHAYKTVAPCILR